MIRFVTADGGARFSETVETFGIYGTKIYAQYQLYGAESGVLDLWSLLDGGRPVGAVSRLGGAFTVAAGAGADPDELAAFLPLAGGCSAEGELALIQRLNAVIQGALCASWILRGGRTLPGPPAAAPRADGVLRSVERAGRMSEVCALHRSATPGFLERVDPDAWLAEASHKQRHGLADYYLLKENNESISTVSILFKGRERAIIAAVATRPDRRGRGCARLLMEHAGREAAAQGLEPWLCAREDGLLNFYRSCGYAPAGRWGRTEWARPGKSTRLDRKKGKRDA